MICILPKLNSLLQKFSFCGIQRLRQNFVLSLTDDSLPNNSIWKSVSKKFSGGKNRFKKFKALKKQAAEKFRFIRKARGYSKIDQASSGQLKNLIRLALSSN